MEATRQMVIDEVQNAHACDLDKIYLYIRQLAQAENAQKDARSLFDDMGLKAPASWLTREECYER